MNASSLDGLRKRLSCRGRVARLTWVVGLTLLGGACAQERPKDAPSPVTSAALGARPGSFHTSTVNSASVLESDPLADAAPGPARVTIVRVPGDRPASWVQGASPGQTHTVFLGGVCSNSGAYLHTFPEAARNIGGVVAIEGERACPGRDGYRTFVRDAPVQNARIEAALAATGVDAIPAGGITLMGYSLGATVVQDLLENYPERYTRAVLIGSPSDPKVEVLQTARAVATISCKFDVPDRMRNAAREITSAGGIAEYFEMPGCTHGLVKDGERVMGSALQFVEQRQRPLIAGSAIVPITGTVSEH